MALFTNTFFTYAKSIVDASLYLLPRSAELDATYSNPDNDPRGDWKAGDLSAGNKGGRATASCIYEIENPETGEKHLPPDGRRWVYNRDKVRQLLEEKRIWFGSDNNGKPKYKRFLSEVRQGMAASKFNALFLEEKDVFETPKPIALIKRCIVLGSIEYDIILDFFSGSATTAHAVMSLNAEDDGQRKFIMVQLPEVCDGKSEAYKAGYKNIAEIGKERIRRAGKKIKAENADNEGIDQLDIGFRVLKIDSSNMRDVYYTPDAVQQGDLVDQIDNIREGRTPEDLLFQVLLDWGVDLTLPITQEAIAGKTVLFVDENALAACFDADINEAFVKELAARHPLRLVFRDAGFVSDNVKINIEQIFKLISPTTEIKVI